MVKEGKIVGGNIVPRTKTKLAKRATWDPEIPVTNLSSVSTQISSSSPDSDPASGINPGLGPGQVSTNVLHRRRETRSKVTIRWAGKITNRRLAKIEKKKAYDTWDYLREKSLPATTTAPFSAAVKSLPPTSDPVPDADTYQNPGRAPTICPDPAPISTYPFPGSILFFCIWHFLFGFSNVCVYVFLIWLLFDFIRIIWRSLFKYLGVGCDFLWSIW